MFCLDRANATKRGLGGNDGGSKKKKMNKSTQKFVPGGLNNIRGPSVFSTLLNGNVSEQK